MVLALTSVVSAAWDYPAQSAENLLVHYEFEGNADNSEYGSMGTDGDGIEDTFSTADHYAAGLYGDGFVFLDVAQTYDFEDTIQVAFLDDLADKTIFFQYKTPDTAGSTWGYIHWGSSRLNLETNNGGTTAIAFIGSPDAWGGTHSPAMTEGTWNDLAVTFADNGDGTVTPKYYVNGSEVLPSGTRADVTPSDSDMGKVLGWGMGDVGDGCYAMMDDYRIYDYAATPAQIANMAEGDVVPEPATIALLGLGGLVLFRKRR
jgi:hypothetical protein